MPFFYNQSPFLQWHFSRRIITYELGLAISQEDEKIYNNYISLINPNIWGPGALLPRELVARLIALERGLRVVLLHLLHTTNSNRG